MIHRQTIDRLRGTARFIGRNQGFVSRVALMGSEPIGFARTNIEALWIDPLDYQQELKDAVDELSQAGVSVKIYSHPLCAAPGSLWKYTVKSISDWKNIYAPECEHSRCADNAADSLLPQPLGAAGLRKYLPTPHRSRTTWLEVNAKRHTLLTRQGEFRASPLAPRCPFSPAEWIKWLL